MKNFENKVAAITGAGSGIGRALALELARRRCHLALSDIDAASLAETANLAAAYGVKVTTAKLDVAKRQSVHNWAGRVVADHGQVNLIFNNAGVAHGGTVEETDYADYEWIMGVNFWGVLHGTKAFLPHLKAAGEGHIINISSVFGLFSQPGVSAYNASKFAVRGLTESLRQELDMAGGAVSATCVHPGGIKTNIARNARMGSSIAQVTGTDAGRSQSDFEKLFRTTPEQAALTILAGVEHNARRVLIGSDARAADVMQRLLPASYQRLVGTSLQLAQRGRAWARRRKTAAG